MPLKFSIRLLTMSMPTPRPEISVMVSAVLRPGCQIKAISSRSESSRASALLTRPLATIFVADSLAVDAAAVVADGDHHAVAAVRGQERHGAGARLARGLALAGRLQPVVDRVADHVDQGVGELVDHPLVELGLLAADLEGHLLARGKAQVADDPPEPLEQRPDRHHPGVEHALLQAVGDPAQAVDRLGERLELLARVADQVELVLDRAEVIAQPADVSRPAVRPSHRTSRS